MLSLSPFQRCVASNLEQQFLAAPSDQSREIVISSKESPQTLARVCLPLVAQRSRRKRAPIRTLLCPPDRALDGLAHAKPCARLRSIGVCSAAPLPPLSPRHALPSAATRTRRSSSVGTLVMPSCSFGSSASQQHSSERGGWIVHARHSGAGHCDCSRGRRCCLCRRAWHPRVAHSHCSCIVALERAEKGDDGGATIIQHLAG